MEPSVFSIRRHCTPRQPRSPASASPTGPAPTISTGTLFLIMLAVLDLRAWARRRLKPRKTWRSGRQLSKICCDVRDRQSVSIQTAALSVIDRSQLKRLRIERRRRVFMSATAKTKKASLPPAPTAAAEHPMFSPAKPRRVFEEIINQIKAQIEDGRLQRGDKLPTERALAAQFRVSRNTVREALRTLEISGLITLKRGPTGGAFVAASDPRILNSQLTSALRLTDFSVADLTQAMRSITVMLLDAAMPTLAEADLQAMEANIKAA